ncbi:AraC family transcriptional regulator [Xanthomonas translucens]|uniref:helix-turn-helix transcriptional regulator n=1 Tax=Xanthomonas campestris pv. translucens TaxID=343 RepID=UPI00272A789D|nr:AraC family transcriptional regulator [Xanthomonas translucens]WLA13577.1 AraC family transcriptional regulator [Xanthomonas translucens]
MLELAVAYPIRVQNGGLFISRGIGAHPTRVIQSYELIFVERGTLSIREQDDDFHIGPGETLILWPGREHAGLGRFSDALRFYWVHFELAPATAVAADGATLLSMPQRTAIRDPERFVGLFRWFLAEQEERRTLPMLEPIVLSMLQCVAGAWPDPHDSDRAGVALAYRARQLIGTQFQTALTASALAAQLHCNPDYLGRIYRRAFATTLTEAIHRQRIAFAEKLLLVNTCSVDEVAQRAGFSDSGYFRRIFRQRLGMTPSAYRRLYCKEHINSG